MKTHTTAPHDTGYRFPSEIISHAVWLPVRFSLSFRDIEERLAQRRIILTSETVRQWCLKCGQASAHERCRRRPRCGDLWQMDEVMLTIRGKNTSSGEPWIKMAMLLTSSCRADATQRPPSDFSAHSSKGYTTSREELFPIN